jgi:broad specificity phosphatase PhoE
MPAVFFITHPDVAIDPSIPVADWPLNARGRARMQAMSASPWASGVRRIFSSSERKARDAAQFLADGLGLHGYSVVDGLGENERSATGYLAQQEFEETLRLLGTEARGRCSIAISPDCRSAGVTSSPQQMVETGSPSIG